MPNPFVFEVHGGCTGDTAREIRHLLNAWSEQNGYDETRCAANRHAWRYCIACMLAHAAQAQGRWLAEPKLIAYGCLWLSPRLARGHASCCRLVFSQYR